MADCPDCGASNMAGADSCEQCGQPLSPLSKPVPVSPIARHIARDRIDELHPKPPHAVQPDTPIKDVLKKLVENAIGCVLVVDGEQLVGVFSERDALMRLGVDAANLGSRPVSEFMTAEPQVLAAKDRVAFAVHRMHVGGFRHVPIVDASRKPTGIVSVRDILRYMRDRLTAVDVE